jgi:hypothetical protein
MPHVNSIDLTPGSKITKNGKQSAAIANHSNPATATATEIATKQNAILAALRNVGIIASS